MILLTSDWHLDDNPANAYRWGAFDCLEAWMAESPDNTQIFHLGDICDRKDRHSAELVNKLITRFKTLVDKGAVIYILMGNHDKPITGTPFWSFLDQMSKYITFVTKPHALGQILLLPYADNPAEAWADIPFNLYRTAFIHQTVTGAKGNNGHTLENNKMIDFPVRLKVYSGDIHTTQTVKRVKYIGAPHPVAFGDDYVCQMIELDDTYNLSREIKVETIQKLMLRIEQCSQLDEIETRPGDQARVICKLPIADIDKWAAIQDEIIAWGADRQIILASVEPEIEGARSASDVDEPDLENDPAYILRLFADAEGIDDKMYEIGIALLKEALG